MTDKTRCSYPPPYDANQPQPTAPVTGAPGVVICQQVGSQPMRMQCGSCHADIITRIEYETTPTTHIIALMLCLLGCFLCSCIPYCVDSCQKVVHYCPRCNASVGTYKN